MKKECTLCKQHLNATSFNKDSRRKDGLRSYCKNCYKEKYGGKEKKRKQMLFYTYGLTTEMYEDLLKTQNNGCAICGKKPNKRPLSVDHCHKTGKIRGLLCQKHNVGIGLFDDNPDLFDAAKQYLEKRS